VCRHCGIRRGLTATPATFPNSVRRRRNECILS
jgi:hypothetical protein